MEFSTSRLARSRVLSRRQRRSLPSLHPLERRIVLAAPSITLVPGPGYFSSGFAPTDMAVGRFNNDNFPDLVVGQSNGFRVLLGDGGGGFTLGTTVGTPFVVGKVAAGDLTGDGISDIVAGALNGVDARIYLGVSNGTTQAPPGGGAVTLPAAHKDIAIADIDGDNKRDVIFAGDSSELFWGNGDGTLGVGVDLTPNPAWDDVAVATGDMDNDGKIDILTLGTTTTGPKMHVLFSRANRTIEYMNQGWNILVNATDVATGDFDNDNRIDVAFSQVDSTGHGAFHIMRNTDVGNSFEYLGFSDFGGMAAARSIAVSDYDKDGKLDVALGLDAQAIWIFGGLGTGNFNPQLVSLTLGQDNHVSIAAADFNADTVPDLAAAFDDLQRIGTVVSPNLRGRVMNDDNQNGTVDAGETGIAGRTVYDDVNDNGAVDAGEQTSVTDANGAFAFAFSPGAHRLRQVLPVGWVQTIPGGSSGNKPTAYSVFVQAGLSTTGWDFGTYNQGTISGRVWNDFNANGIFDQYESALAGRTVYIDANNNGGLDAGEVTAVTNSFGNYRFFLPEGTWRVRQALPAGWYWTFPSSVYNIFASPTQPAANKHFGQTQLGTISGRVFYDITANTYSEDSDPGQSGFVVYIDYDYNGVPAAWEYQTTTNAQGRYTFSNVYPGSYSIRVVKPSGWEQTYPVPPAGSTDAPFNTRANGGFDSSYTDFGVIYPSFVSGRVFEDVDANGTQAASGEPGLANFHVFVDVDGDGSAGVNDPYGLTNALGDYQLRVPVSGNYNVGVIRLSGYQSTVPAGGLQPVSLTPGASVSGKNFGLKTGAFNNAGFKTPVNFDASQFDFVNPSAVATGDFNNDNKQDFAVANNSADVTFFQGNGTGGFTRSSAGFAGTSLRAITAAHLNSDSFLDLIVANLDSNDVSVLLGNGNGTFQTHVDYAAAPGSQAVVAADFTGDNMPDLVVGGRDSDQLSFLRNNGNGTFAAATNIANAYGSHGLAVGDFNKDGKLDVVSANDTSSSVTILRGNGNGTFLAPLTLTTGLFGPGYVAVGDFNKDTFADLAVVNMSTDNVRVFNGTVNATFSAGTNYAVGSMPNQVAVLDVDLDGWLDLAIAYRSDGTTDISGGVNILRNHQDGAFEVPLTCTAHTSPTAVSVADFNNDGMPDLVAPNYFSDDVSVMINDRAVPGGSISGTVFDDLNGNGTREGAEGGVASRVVFLDANNNTTLDAGETQTTTDAAGQFTFPPLAPGPYVIRLVPDPAWSQTAPAGGAEHSLTLASGANANLLFGLHDVRAPAIFAAQFLYESGPIAVRVVFDENVAASLAAGDLQLTNLTTGQVIPQAQVILNYTAATGVASFTFSGNTLPDGNYRATMAASQVTDASNNALAESLSLDFFVLAGDANRDRAVNFFDLTALAANYGLSNRAMADGDFNGDGTVNFFDLTALAANYGATLPAPSEPVAGAPLAAAAEPLAPSASEPATAVESSAPVAAAIVEAPADQAEAVPEVVAAPLAAPRPVSVSPRRAHAVAPKPAAASDPPRPGPVVAVRRDNPQPTPVAPAPLPPSPFAIKPRKRLPGHGIFSATRVGERDEVTRVTW